VYAGGGGGRVAVKLASGSDTDDVTLQAHGGATDRGSGVHNGAPGTIYLQTFGQASGEGTLTVDAGGQSIDPVSTTLISSNVTGAVVGDVSIVRGSTLGIGDQGNLQVQGSWTNGGSFASATNGTVTFTGTDAATLWGSQTFYNLAIGGSATKPLTFEDGTTQTVIGDLWINRATLRSTSPGSAWYLTLDLTTGTQSLIERADVQDSDASGGQTIDAGAGSADSGRNVNWTFPARGTLVIIR